MTKYKIGSSMRVLGAILGLSTVGLTAVLIWLCISCGSLHAGISYLSGDRLLVDAPSRVTRDLAAGEEGAVEFVLSNRADIPITILGARSSCSCTATHDLPLRLPPSSSRSIRVTYRPRSDTKPGAYPQTVQLYTDYPKRATLPLILVGRVAQAAAPSQAPPSKQGE